MIKTIKLHCYNMRMANNGLHFRSLISSMVSLLFINSFASYLLWRTPYIMMSNTPRNFLLMLYIVFLTLTVNTISSGGYLKLHNSLPVSKRELFLGRSVFMFILGTIAWMASTIPLFISILVSSASDAEVVGSLFKLHFFISSILIIGGLGLNASLFNSTGSSLYPAFLGFAVYRYYPEDLFSSTLISTNKWLIYPVVCLLTALVLLIGRCLTLNATDLLKESGSKVKSGK